jgi:hypothetical protein
VITGAGSFVLGNIFLLDFLLALSTPCCNWMRTFLLGVYAYLSDPRYLLRHPACVPSSASSFPLAGYRWLTAWISFLAIHF